MSTPNRSSPGTSRQGKRHSLPTATGVSSLPSKQQSGKQGSPGFKKKDLSGSFNQPAFFAGASSDSAPPPDSIPLPRFITNPSAVTEYSIVRRVVDIRALPPGHPVLRLIGEREEESSQLIGISHSAEKQSVALGTSCPDSLPGDNEKSQRLLKLLRSGGGTSNSPAQGKETDGKNVNEMTRAIKSILRMDERGK